MMHYPIEIRRRPSRRLTGAELAISDDLDGDEPRMVGGAFGRSGTHLTHPGDHVAHFICQDHFAKEDAFRDHYGWNNAYWTDEEEVEWEALQLERPTLLRDWYILQAWRLRASMRASRRRKG